MFNLSKERIIKYSLLLCVAVAVECVFKVTLGLALNLRLCGHWGSSVVWSGLAHSKEE